MGIQNSIIKTTSCNQEEIIKNIIKLYCPKGIELDPTYSKGNFYKNIKKPKYKHDIKPQTKDVLFGDCRKLSYNNESIESIMFDPPFIAGKSLKSEGIIRNRFSSFKDMKECWEFYYYSLIEFYRILKNKGILIFKCQDTISGGKQYLSHVEIINYAIKLGFYPKDLFILISENRIIGRTHKKQQHARKYHSYFLVFIKEKNKVEYCKRIYKPLKEGNKCNYSGKCSRKSFNGKECLMPKKKCLKEKE